ncbi:MAG: ORF6N domain-containing protein [Campylobacterota bacterium]|nr:ORF6N domain-containing protein [Campylobacterota bacterium]
MDLIKQKQLSEQIYTIREEKVMIDSDLAKLYQVETKVLNQAVKRNIDRFPSDLMFQLTDKEFEILRSQNVTSSWGGRRYIPNVFTEQGVYMLATVLKSKVATEVTLNIMRTFTKMREFSIGYKDIVEKLNKIEKTIIIDQQQLNFNTERIDEALELLNQILRDTQNTSKNLIGFRPK